MMPLPVCRKTRIMEKLKSSTALHARGMIPSTHRDHITSRLRDARAIGSPTGDAM
jgi:hypothetical protein